MGMKVTWETKCDGCGMLVTHAVIMGEDGWRRKTWYDTWGPGLPEGWIQKTDEKVPKLFHDGECLKEWLITQGRHDEAERFSQGFWMA